MTLDWEQVMNEHPEQPILHLNYEDMKEVRTLHKLRLSCQVHAYESQEKVY